MDTNQQHQSVFTFTGTGSEYFRIWIVNILLSVLTLGIYSAWAKVRTNRYFYGNTHLDDASFEYHATGLTILKGRIIAFALLAIYILTSQFSPLISTIIVVLLALLTPLAIWSSLRFNARMSSFRNVRFDFNGSIPNCYKILLLIPAIPFIVAAGLGVLAQSMGAPILMVLAILCAMIGSIIIAPVVHTLFMRFFINGSQYGQGPFSAQLHVRDVFWIYFKTFLMGVFGLLLILGLSTFGFVGMGLNFSVFVIVANNPELGPELLLMILPILIFIYAMLILLGTTLQSYLHVSISQYMYNNTHLDDAISFKADYNISAYVKLQLVNMLMLLSTLGFAYPWVKVRLAIFTANGLSVASSKDKLAEYATQQEKRQNALGDEIGEAFDAGIDTGLTL